MRERPFGLHIFILLLLSLSAIEAQNFPTSTPTPSDLSDSAALIRSEIDKEVQEYNKAVESDQSRPLFEQYVKEQKEGKKSDYYIEEKPSPTPSPGEKFEESYLKEQWEYQKEKWDTIYQPVQSNENYSSPNF